MPSLASPFGAKHTDTTSHGTKHGSPRPKRAQDYTTARGSAAFPAKVVGQARQALPKLYQLCLPTSAVSAARALRSSCTSSNLASEDVTAPPAAGANGLNGLEAPSPDSQLWAGAKYSIKFHQNTPNWALCGGCRPAAVTILLSQRMAEVTKEGWLRWQLAEVDKTPAHDTRATCCTSSCCYSSSSRGNWRRSEYRCRCRCRCCGWSGWLRACGCVCFAHVFEDGVLSSSAVAP